MSGFWKLTSIAASPCSLREWADRQGSRAHKVASTRLEDGSVVFTEFSGIDHTVVGRESVSDPLVWATYRQIGVHLTALAHHSGTMLDAAQTHESLVARERLRRKNKNG